VETVRRAVEQVLCLFPFEPAFYAERGVCARYIGHPLADRLDNSVSASSARAQLGCMDDAGPVLTVLPGSRGSEVGHLMPLFAQAAQLLVRQIPGLRLILPVAKPGLRAPIEAAIAAHAPQLDWTLLDGQSHEAVRAGDAVLVASGTATLECLLLGRPMTVAYKGSALTAWLLLKAGMLKTPYVSLPNLLCAEPVVTELLQDRATPEALAADVLPLLTDPHARRRQTAAFDAVRQQLRKNAAACAAEEIAALLRRPIPHLESR
jgi:lipid-A-disaccharide synthase